MKNKIFKITIASLLLMTLTMTNFLMVGANLISYATDNVATNHQNVEFEAYFESNTFLCLRVKVKKEGYFNGEVALDKCNFTLKESESDYINKIENNTIYLNQINAGAVAEIKVAIEPMKYENFSIGLLNMASQIKVKGIYRDSTEKDIKIEASRELKLELTENNTADNLLNEMKVITNKIVKIDGQEKRMVQFSYHIGLKENNYPIREITSKIAIPTIDEKQAEVYKVAYLNNMTSFDYKYDGKNIELTLKNEPTSEGKIKWKAQGSEEVIITCLYDKDVKLEDSMISTQEKITLYNNKEIEAENKITVGTEELDSVIEVNIENSEEVIYKGKIDAGIDRQYETTTKLKINFAKAIQGIKTVEKSSQDSVNVIYNMTTISKEQFDKIFGQNGKITIYNQNDEIVSTITNATPINQEGNIVVNYEGKDVKEIRMQTTAPIEEGMLEYKHIKTIKGNGDSLKNEVIGTYQNSEVEKVAEASIQLEDATTKATLEINKENLSTVVANDVEMKVILVSNNEKYDLYQNPEITLELPEQVENVKINSIDLLYENELKVKDYTIDGRTIKVYLEGEQTQYKEDVVEGATIVIRATIIINRKSATKDEEVQMRCTNQKADEATTSKTIKIVAPTEMTTINSIQDLGIETLGQETTKQVFVPRGSEEKQLEAQIEIINNNENDVENIKILGEFPTNHNANNMGIQITKEMALLGIENAKIYYSENTNATDEIDNVENDWKETITDNAKVSKYLIVIEKMEAQGSVKATYQYQIPANLEYNQTAKTGYQVKYTNSSTKVESSLTATTIEMQTGIGPKVETKLIATVGGNQIASPVKNGSIIQYRIEVSNTGTEDINNVKVTGNIPEGTTMVEPEENYEYTGASYYQELDNQTYETTIENLKIGEVVTKQYEVRVNSNVAEGTTISNTAQISYADVIKQSDEIKNVTAKGNLSAVVKRVTDRSVKLYTSGIVQYFAIIENISSEKQEDIKIQTNLPENLKVERLQVIAGMEKENDDIPSIQSEIVDYNKEINIGTLEPGEIKVLSYDMSIQKAQDSSDEINFSVTAKNGQEEYASNNWEDEVSHMEIAMAMTANTETQYLKAGDVVEYTIVVKNKTNADANGLVLKDNIPTQLTIQQITKDETKVEGIKGNNLEIPLRMEANATTTIKIEAVVNYSEGRDKAEAITNVAYAEIYGEKVATTSEMTHIIQANENSAQPGENGEIGGNDGNDIENNDIAKGKGTIAGVAWYDENANGQKEQGETLLSKVTVRLLNTETNNLVKGEDGKVLEATTNENGIYVLDKIGNGKYIVIFDYDDTQYTLTKYKVEGVSEEENSNAIKNELLIENEKKQVASTDILEVENNNISNINIGLIKPENFDLKLDKYVSKILIQDANGTTLREYNNETMAKVELDAKKINGSTVIVEYKILVTNQGEVEGYAKKIADYASTELKFSSELNKDWYQVGETLYTATLANEKIKPGETKAVTLTLTKTMTENSTGLIPNTAEIAEDYNELGIADSNSIPGNRAKGENDMGAADVMLSIRTGGAVYITIVIIILVVLGGIAVVILKKKNEKKKE